MATTHDSYAALRVRDFRRFIVSLWTMTVATQIESLVVAWQIFEKTKDPLALGLVGLAEALPFIGMAVFAGHLADRTDRRKVALLSYLVLLACGISLLAFSIQDPDPNSGPVWPIYVVVFVSGIARSFAKPAATALSAQLIARDLYANAVVWRTSTWQFAAVLGPAIGGLLFGFGSAVIGYAADVTLMAIAVVTFSRIAPRATEATSEQISIGQSLTSGIRFVLSKRVLIGAMSLDLFSVFFGGAVALLPFFAEMLGAGPEGLGILRAAPAVGSVFMGLHLAHRRPFARAGVTLLASVAAFGFFMIAFALSRHFWLSAFLLVAGGAADSISVVIRATLLQTLTPSHIFGRVSAVNQIFVGSSNEIGAFESGVAARLLGTVPSVIFGGAMTILVVIITALMVPDLRKLQRIEEGPSGEK